MNLLPLFAAVTAAGLVANYLDWKSTVDLITKHGLAGEANPIMRFFLGKSKWLGLAYKAVPPAILIYSGCFFKGGDIQNYGIQYTNADGVDRWAIVWILSMAAYAGVGLYGYLHNRNQK